MENTHEVRLVNERRKPHTYMTMATEAGGGRPAKKKKKAWHWPHKAAVDPPSVIMLWQRTPFK